MHADDGDIDKVNDENNDENDDDNDDNDDNDAGDIWPAHPASAPPPLHPQLLLLVQVGFAQGRAWTMTWILNSNFEETNITNKDNKNNQHHM